MNIKKYIYALIKRGLIFCRLLPDVKAQLYRKSYSQDGEDVILHTLIMETRPNYKGFYVDIGAYHPMRFSNTQMFYEEGWGGVNIDANPNSMIEFNKFRQRDINITAGVSDRPEELDYYVFEESALNCFDKNRAEELIEIGWKLKEIIKVKCLSINDILERNFDKKHIDFITIDVEGMELQILQSLDFQKYAPDFFLIEENDFTNKDFMDYKVTPIYVLLRQHNYIVVAKTMRTVIYKKVNI
ncbi:MAG: FkbM family methyltransferase [Candidatus Margulisbacteria bacterium]|jgi:FkbM family methyltransferase|nr:FkbM family methyltransferase [Candidatus Margulisiibacteriota bacterium]